MAGRPANNVLLTGARGTGKSSLVKAALNEFAPKGLRLIEVDKRDLVDLPDIVDLVGDRDERFVIFCDDLSFEASDSGYKSLKVALDGSIAGSADNVLIYATSNRRHLMPEFMDENLEARHVGGEIHPGETTEEKISLSERFGLWLSFYPFDQEQYLDIADHWVERARRQGDRGVAQGRAAVGARARAAQRPRRLAVRPRLGWKQKRHADDAMNTDQGDLRRSQATNEFTWIAFIGVAVGHSDHRSRAAVIERPGEFLLAQRPEGKPYSGYWEFPGGKIEAGEDPREALVRELRGGTRHQGARRPRPGSRACTPTPTPPCACISCA